MLAILAIPAFVSDSYANKKDPSPIVATVIVTSRGTVHVFPGELTPQQAVALLEMYEKQEGNS